MFRGFHEEDYHIHSHDFAEFTIITEGHCTHMADGFEYELKRGEVYVILPNVWHGLKNLTQTIRQYTFMFNLSNLILFDVELKNLPGFFAMFMPSQSDSFPNRLYLNEEELQSISNLCEIMLKEYEEKKAGYELVLRAMLISLIGIILRSYHSESGKNFDNYDKIIPVLKYIEEHFSEKITLENLAEQCYLSGRQLSRIFTKIYGMSPIDYLVNYRLTTAYLYLLSSDYSAAVIAEKCGFYDESHMSRLFFKRYGFMPKSVKKNDDYFRTPKEDLDKIDS